MTYPSESPSGPVGGSAVISFPPRNEPNAFFQNLIAYYRDVLRRPTSSTYVDPEGVNVWLTEYFRFYLNGCTHAESVVRTIAEIQFGGTQPTCGVETPTFPPRNLPFEFQGILEATYRDALRRPVIQSFVDSEGANVWLAQYLRFRVSGCDHGTAENKVFTEIRGGGVQPACSGGGSTLPNMTGRWIGSIPGYTNMLIDLTQNGFIITGTFFEPFFGPGTVDPASPGRIDGDGNFEIRFKLSRFSDFSFRGRLDSSRVRATGGVFGSGFNGEPFIMLKQ